MRIWSLHPHLLDRQGLVALWRETLLAQAVLAGRTKGYRSHPQLARFRSCPEPLGAVTSYLDEVQLAATRRGYNFDPTRIDAVPRWQGTIDVTDAQLEYEWGHLLAKTEARSPEHFEQLKKLTAKPHPLFTVVQGPIADWERIK